MVIKGTAHKLQFISVLPTDFMQKMLIPANFVQRYIPKEYMNDCMATVLGPLGKVFSVQLEMDRLDLFFTGGWSRFVALHGITEADSLQLRFEDNMVFTVKVFGPNGCQREFKYLEIRVQQNKEKEQEAPSVCIRRRKVKNKTSFMRYSTYKIGHQSWIKKQINTISLGKHLSLARAFCGAIGLQQSCLITLKTSMDSAKSWLVHGFQSKTRSYILGKGWRQFCQDNNLKEGDICTFSIIKTTLWHVAIMHCKEQMKQFCNETPSISGRKCKSMHDRLGSEGQKMEKGSMTSLNKASSENIGSNKPSAKITKTIGAKAIEDRLYLSQVFCNKIGIQGRSTITLKTSMSGDRLWQVRVLPYTYGSCQVVGPGWRRFCSENKIKAGDRCTFLIVEITEWHVIIKRLIS